MKTSIVILNWNTLPYLKRCVNSIRKYTESYELIIVDNGSTEKGTKKYIMKNADKYIFNKENLGFSKGNNQGAKLSKGKYLCFMNSDITVGRNWLSDMLEIFKKDEKCGAVGPLANPIQQSVNNRLFRFNQWKGQYPIDTQVNCLIGFCILIKRDLFNEISGWDEDFFNGFEDNWLSLTLKNKGYNLWVSVKSKVKHYAGASHTINKIDYLDSLTRNHIIFNSKLMNLNKNVNKVKNGY